MGGGGEGAERGGTRRSLSIGLHCTCNERNLKACRQAGARRLSQSRSVPSTGHPPMADFFSILRHPIRHCRGRSDIKKTTKNSAVCRRENYADDTIIGSRNFSYDVCAQANTALTCIFAVGSCYRRERRVGRKLPSSTTLIDRKT